MLSDHAVYDDGVLRITRSGNPPVVALAGEIDEATYSGLVDALAEAAAGQREVHFDLGGVRYCDLAGLRAIVCVTGADRDGRVGCRRVVLHQLPPELETILRIVGWNSTPGLGLGEPPGDGGPPRPDPVIAAPLQAEGSL